MKDRRHITIVTTAAFFIAAASAISMIWQTNVSKRHRLHVEYAENVLSEFLHLKANVYQLFKQFGDALIIGVQDQGAGEAALTEEIDRNFIRLRVLIGKEIELIGESELDELTRLNEVEDAVERLILRFEQFLAEDSTAQDPSARWEILSQILDVEIDRDFLTLIQRAVDDERQEVVEVRAAMVKLERDVTYGSIILAVFALVTVLFALSSFYRRFSDPLALVFDGTQRFSKGQYDHRIDLKGDGDIAKIGHSLNLMAEQVEIRTQDLVKKNVELEDRVRERTIELERLLSLSEQMERNRTQLLADVSHEIRTPLTIIQGEAEIALRGGQKEADEYREALQQALEAAKHCGQLVNDLLLVSRQEAGALRLDRSKADLLDVVGEAAKIFGQGVATRFHVSEAVAEIDAVRIRQSILALLQNSRRYGAEHIELSVDSSKDSFKVMVSDDGVGMPDDEKSQAFERFFRGSNAAQHYSEGTGLGLPVVQAIVSAHGGRVLLGDSASGGLTVTFDIPKTQGQVGQRDAEILQMQGKR